MPSDDSADRDLLGRIAAGDQDAMHALYDAYYPRLWRYLWYALAMDATLTEEVLQDCMLAIWQHARSFHGRAKVATWIFQIAHNRASNARRAEQHLAFAYGYDDTDAADTASLEDTVINRLALAEA